MFTDIHITAADIQKVAEDRDAATNLAALWRFLAILLGLATLAFASYVLYLSSTLCVCVGS